MQRICARCQFRMLTRGATCQVCGFDKLVPHPSEIQSGPSIKSASKTLLRTLKTGITFAAQYMRTAQTRIDFQQPSAQCGEAPRPVPPVSSDCTPDSPSINDLQRPVPAVPVLPMPELDFSPPLSPETSTSTAANIHKLPTYAARYGELEIVTTRRQLAELKNWFENYGKNGLLFDASKSEPVEDLAA